MGAASYRHLPQRRNAATPQRRNAATPQRRNAATEFVAGTAWVFKAQMVLRLIFPFTRLVHLLGVPFKYVLRPSYQAVRKRG